MPANLRVLIPEEKLQARVREMGEEISRDYPDGPLYLVGILKGSFIFLADLARSISRDVRIDFIGISSYGRAKTSSGEVKVTKDLDISIEGQHVLLVEDIVDSGVTLTYLMKLLAQRKPKSVRIATMLDKPERRQRPGGRGVHRLSHPRRVCSGIRARPRGRLPAAYVHLRA